jgi:hypothetical protein
VDNIEHSFETFAQYIEEMRDEDLIFSPFEIDMSDLDEEEVVDKALGIIYREMGQ